MHYFKHFMYITNFYTLSFSAEQFLACAGGLCVWHTIYKASILESSYHRNENSQNGVDPLNSSSSLIMNTSLKRRFILLERGRYIFHNRNNTFKCSIHSLSIYYGNWCCAKLRRQDNQCGFLSPRSCVAGKRVALILVVVTQNHPDTWTHGHLSRQNFLKCLR